jgi:hypothetical protein
MSYLDSADCLARCKMLARRPTTDEEMSDANWYSFLTEAQDYWVRVIAQHAPNLLCGVPTALTTADSGLTYTFSTVPIAVLEVTTAKGGLPVTIGPYYDQQADFTWEGESTLRACRNSARTFSSGLYARWVVQPGAVSASSEPTLNAQYRLLLVPRAVTLWARRGGARDPAPYLAEEQRLWMGDGLADLGLFGALKKKVWHQNQSGGMVPFWRMGSMNV